MLRSARLAPGRRALLARPHPPTMTTTRTITNRPITFTTGQSSYTRPFTFTGSSGPTAAKPTSNLLPRGRPSAWSPSTIATLAGGSMLVGTWYIVEEGRSYRVGDQIDPYEPRVLGTHREGKVNRDYANYEQWVERHHQGRRGRKREA